MARGQDAAASLRRQVTRNAPTNYLWVSCRDGQPVTSRGNAAPEEQSVVGDYMKMSLRRLAARVGTEGGIVAALDYGIRGIDIEDADVAALWAQLDGLYTRMVPLMDQLDRRIREARAA
jgi:hypothetical protein